MRASALVLITVVGACAHVAPTQPAQLTSPTADVVAQLRACVDTDELCRALTARLEQTLRERRDDASAHRLAERMTRTLKSGEATPVLGDAIAGCRRGRQTACRALWWAMDRLYLADDATPARASECALTHALAAAIEPARGL